MTSCATSPPGLGPLTPSSLDLDAVRTAIAPPNEAAAAWRRWLTESDIDSGQHRQLELFPLALTNLPVGTMAPADQGIVKGLTRRSWYLQQRLAGALGPALERIEAVGGRPLLTGGLVLAWARYPTPGARHTDGADVLVAPEVVAEAEAALVDEGWAAAAPSSARPEATRVLQTAEGDVLRLHRWAFVHRHEGDDQGLHDAALALQVGTAGSWPRMADADLLVLGVLDGLRTGRLVWLVDAALLVHAGVDWDAVLRRSEPPAVAVRLLPGLHLLCDELAVDVPHEVLERLAAVEVPLPAQVRWAAERRFGRGDRLFLYRSVTRAEGRRPSLAEYARLRRADRAGTSPA
jgi:hypothetical protein